MSHWRLPGSGPAGGARRRGGLLRCAARRAQCWARSRRCRRRRWRGRPAAGCTSCCGRAASPRRPRWWPACAARWSCARCWTRWTPARCARARAALLWPLPCYAAPALLCPFTWPLPYHALPLRATTCSFTEFCVCNLRVAPTHNSVTVTGLRAGATRIALQSTGVQCGQSASPCLAQCRPRLTRLGCTQDLGASASSPGGWSSAPASAAPSAVKAA